MTIRFVPNDPLAGLPPRLQLPRPDPPPPGVRFAYGAPAAEGVHPIGSPAFLFWQCREAALATLEVWTMLATAPPAWHGGGVLLPLNANDGVGLNAHYDRNALSFFEWTVEHKTTWSGASVDAVAHEVGHALLDAVRPDLWDSGYPECAAFHEAFADCMALLVGLFDADCRAALLGGGPGLRGPNFLERVAEDVADTVRREDGPQHPHAAPRRALNDLQWEIPVNLQPSAPADALSSEPHSFSRIFTGSFYDLVCNLFAAQPGGDGDALLGAAEIAGRLLVQAAANAPEVARFFQAVGRAMVLDDETRNGGRSRDAIRDAFRRHNVSLGTSSMLAPSSGLAGAAPRVAEPGTRALVAPDTRRHLLRRLHAPRGGRLRVDVTTLGRRAIAKASHRRLVALGTLHPGLRGVVAAAVESVLVGSSAARAVVLGRLPDPEGTIDEVRHFVRTLLENDALRVDAASKRARGAVLPGGARLPTHVVRLRGGKKILARVRFSC